MRTSPGSPHLEGRDCSIHPFRLIVETGKEGGCPDLIVTGFLAGGVQGLAPDSIQSCTPQKLSFLGYLGGPS